MKHSIVLASINEGPCLELTIASLLAGDRVPDEILVMDDAGTEPIGDRLRHFPKTKVFTEKTRQGCARARHRLCTLAMGSLITVCDSHMVFQRDTLAILEDEHRFNPRAILCPTVIDTISRSGPHGPGAALIQQGGFYAAKWVDGWAQRVSVRRVPAPLGACYTIPRDLLDSIGGFAPALIGYGVDEPYLAMRAWLCGWECKGVPAASVQHRFWHVGDKPKRASLDAPTGDGESYQHEIATNNHIASRVCFGDAIWHRHFRPREAWNDVIERRIESVEPEIRHAQAIVHANRTRTHEQVAAICGVPIPI